MEPTHTEQTIIALDRIVYDVRCEYDLRFLFSEPKYLVENIKGGYKITASFDAKEYRSGLELQEYDLEVQSKLMAYSLLMNKKYQISNREIVSIVNGSPIPSYDSKAWYGEELDNQTIWKDRDGHIFLNVEKELSDLVGFSSAISELVQLEPVLKFVIRKFNEAYYEIDNELFHLYDIREAIDRYFKDQGKDYKNELRISLKEHSEFGKFINGKPIFRSRHPGKFVGKFEPLNGDEVRKLRSFCRKLILSLVDNLLTEYGYKAAE